MTVFPFTDVVNVFGTANSSALCRLTPWYPPASRTCPESIGATATSSLALTSVPMPFALKAPVFGSYASAVLRSSLPS